MAKGHVRQDTLVADPLSASSRLPKRTPWLKNRLGLATFPEQIRLYARSLNLQLGTILCTNYRKRHQSVQSFSSNNFLPTTEALDETRRHDEWLHIQEHSFAIKKIGQYFRTCKPLSAQDADGGRGREHVGGLFSDVCARKGKQLITTSDLMSVWSSRRILQLRP